MQTIHDQQIGNNNIERAYSLQTPLEHRKKYAQFFTPSPIAELMADWLLGNPKLQEVLEPAFGLGIFARTLLERKKNLKIKGFEVDFKIFEEAKFQFKGKENVQLILEDYLYNDWDSRYDGIICNPPYFKFHDYDNKTALLEIEQKLGVKLTGFTNLYTLFLLKSIHQLKPGGRAAYLVPSEFLNSDYGKLVKADLLKTGTLRHIAVIDFEENVFEDALTTASILLLAKDEHDASIGFTNIKTLGDLGKLQTYIQDYPNGKSDRQYPPQALNPDVKWRNYYQGENALKYKHLIPFSNYGKVVRGIATGDNNFFTFNASKAEQWGIQTKYLLPCISKSADVKGAFFTQADFEQLVQADKSVYLLNAVNAKDAALERYLAHGVEQGASQRFLTAARNPWYALENRPPAPIWVSVFNRNGLRFIRNEAGIRNLTTFHCVYLDLFSAPKADLFFAYLLTNISKDIFNDNRREYGNGLHKFEPNDLNKAQMLDLNRLGKAAEGRILELYGRYRASELGKEPDLRCLGEMEGVFLEGVG